MRIVPVLMLLLLTTVLPELLTGSTPLVGFLNPGLLLFLGLAYGLVILLIRELAVRHDVGLRGLIFFGLAYGILNEGLLAKTFITHNDLPVREYDAYGLWLGISVPWAVCISTWHGFASVVFPISLTHFFFPQSSRRPWLNRKVAITLGVVVILLASLFFLGTSPKGVKGMPLQLAVMLTTMFVLAVLGLVFKGALLTIAGSTWFKPMLVGLSVILPFHFLATTAASKISPVVFFLIFAGICYAYGWTLKRCGWLSLPGFLYFGIGWYAQNATVSILIRLGNPPLAVTAALVDSLVLGLLCWQIRRNAHALCGVPLTAAGEEGLSK